MYRTSLFLIILLSVFARPLRAQQNVTLTAGDGVQVYGAYYPAKGESAPVILLFHQAQSNHSEYAPIAPRLVAEGFSCLAIDQRSGDNMWGKENQTVAHLGKSTDYLETLPDLEEALAWARQQEPNRKVILWGSSYSSSLVFVLAAKHPGEITALLAFSPDEYFHDKHLIEDAAARLMIPVFVTSAKDAGEIAAAKAIVAKVPNKSLATQYVPRISGVHGSSTLREDRNAKGAEENWDAVLKFLRRFRGR